MAESGSKALLEPEVDGPRRRPSAIPGHVTNRLRMPRKSLTGMQAESLKERQVPIDILFIIYF